MKRMFLIVTLLASATAASASVTYDFHYHSNSFGSTDWVFTVPTYLSVAGPTYITSFDSASSQFVGNILDVRVFDPFSGTPFIATDGDQGSLSTGGWVGPFDHDGTFTAVNTTLIITSTSTNTGAPEPSPLALMGAGGVVFALLRRRGWLSRKPVAN